MPWTKLNYPNAMKNLPGEVRNKAIEIGNALISEQTMEEGIAIATAISRAKDWAANRGKKFENPDKSNISDIKKHGQDRYVIPYANMWGIKVEGEEAIEQLFPTKKEAVQQARREAKVANASLTILQKSGKIEKRISYTPHKTAKKQTVVTKVKKRVVEFN